jgi:hypothetical protein
MYAFLVGFLGSKLHGSPCARAVRVAVGPFLSGSSAFVDCAISYNRLGFSRKPYRALAPNLSVLSGYPARESIKIQKMRKIKKKIQIEILVLLRNQKFQNEFS